MTLITGTKTTAFRTLLGNSLLAAAGLSIAIGFSPVQAKSTQTKEIKARTKTQSKQESPKKSISKKKPKRVVRKKRSVFVPPPPPSIPSVLNSDSLSLGSTIGIEYMSLDDLKFKRTSMQKQLSSLEMDMEDSLMAMKDSKRRSDTFDDLFKEGVVSKKELFQAKREAKRMARSIERDKLEIEETKRVIEAINSRIKRLETSKAKSKKYRKKTRTKKR